MRLMMNLCLGSLTLAFLTLLVGVVGCSANNCPTGFDLGAIAAAGRWAAGTAQKVQQDATTPDENPRPIHELAEDNVRAWGEWADEKANAIADGQADFRLTACPPDKVADAPQEMSYEDAEKFLANPGSSKSQVLVQISVRPACESGNILRFLVAGGRFIDVAIDGDKVKIEKFNW